MVDGQCTMIMSTRVMTMMRIRVDDVDDNGGIFDDNAGDGR